MRPTLRQLDYIVTTHRLGRFSLAAEALNVSQPSLSTQIAAVETELGIRIFERGRNGVELTSKGEEFVVRAQKILSDVNDLRGAMMTGLPFGGRLRLGVLPSIGPYLLPMAIRKIHQLQPQLRFILREESTQELERGLKSGRFDLIISTPEDHPGTLQTRLFTENLWLAVAADDPLATSKAPARAADLQGRNFLTLDSGHRLTRITYALASTCGGLVSDEYAGTSLESILLMAATGTGIAILPELFAKRQAALRSEICLRPLQIDGADRELMLISRRQSADDDGASMLAKVLNQTAAELGIEQT